MPPASVCWPARSRPWKKRGRVSPSRRCGSNRCRPRRSGAARAFAWPRSGATPRFERVDGSATELPALPSRETIEARAAASPQLRRAQLEVQRRRALADVERARGVPDLTLSLGVKRDQELGRNQAVIGLALPLPVFDNNRGNLLEALRREDKARDELAATRTRLVSEALQAREQLDAARAEAKALQDDILPGAQSAYQASSKGFELGKFGFLDVLDAQRTLFQAKAQHLNALAQAHRAAAEIDKLLGDSAEPSPHTKPGSAPGSSIFPTHGQNRR